MSLLIYQKFICLPLCIYFEFIKLLIWSCQTFLIYISFRRNFVFISLIILVDERKDQNENLSFALFLSVDDPILFFARIGLLGSQPSKPIIVSLLETFSLASRSIAYAKMLIWISGSSQYLGHLNIWVITISGSSQYLGYLNIWVILHWSRYCIVYLSYKIRQMFVFDQTCENTKGGYSIIWTSKRS